MTTRSIAEIKADQAALQAQQNQLALEAASIELPRLEAASFFLNSDEVKMVFAKIQDIADALPASLTEQNLLNIGICYRCAVQGLPNDIQQTTARVQAATPPPADQGVETE